jgi:hypothetical protein
MIKGTQIAYIPTHAEGNINHHDVEFGFVTSERGDAHFCRYWIPVSIRAQSGMPMLRTLTNSELTPTDMLMAYESVDQSFVEDALAKIEKERERYESHDLRCSNAR